MFGSHLQSGLASSLEKLAPCRLIGVRLNIRRGIHGSTSEHRVGLCAVFSVFHEHVGATASDLGSVGECANLVRVLVLGWKMCNLNEICTDTHLLFSCGKDNLREFNWDLDGKSTELGLSFCSPKTRIVLIGIRG